MSNSLLVQATILSPNHSGRRNRSITKIAFHHAAGVINGRNLAGVFVPKSRRKTSLKFFYFHITPPRITGKRIN